MAIINLIYFFLISILMTIYFDEVGCTDEVKNTIRINNNYEFYRNLSKISMFTFRYFMKFYSNDNFSMKLIFNIFVLILSLSLFIYCYKKVLIYNKILYCINLYGWAFVSWYSIMILFSL